MVSQIIVIRKDTESTFAGKVSIFRQKVLISAIFEQFTYIFFLHLGMSDSKWHSYQISAQMNNIERF